MKLALDTSVLVAALVEAHRFHDRTRPWTEASTSGAVSAQCSWHALAETWSVLTRIPLDPPISSTLAEVALSRLRDSVQPVELTADHYEIAMRRCADRGLRSGALFDALHLVAAESGQVDAFVTFNPVDFERLRTPSSPMIVVPPDPPRLMDLPS